MELELQQLVERARGGDASAWAPLIDEFLETVLGASYARTRSWDAAADCAQAAFAAAMERIGELREPAAFPGWLLAIVRSHASRERRRAARRSAGSVAPASLTPDAALIAARECDALRLALEALPEAQRLPLVLHYFAELPLAEVAALCATSVPTLKKRMRSARARLRVEGAAMAEQIRAALTPADATRAGELVQWFCAVRAGDVARAAALLDANPALVDAREHFSERERMQHRLALNHGGTALLRAIERGHGALVELLLARGASPNVSCACGAGETPLWAAAVHGDAPAVARLLACGADPNTRAFGRTSALHVAHMRGHRGVAELLRAHGADPEARDARGRTPRECGQLGAPAASDEPRGVWWTGVRALDLFAPLPDRGLVRWTAPPGAGSVVLLGELAFRAGREGRAVVWTGFVSPPLAANDLRHGVAELGVAACVMLALADERKAREAQIAAFEHALAQASDALLVVFEAPGFSATIESHLPELCERDALTIVVAPFGASPPAPAGSPYSACVAFDAERAARERWPALGADGSWSRATPPGHAALTARARERLARGGSQADALHAWLTQPFFCAEPFSGRKGEWTSREDWCRELGALVGA
jgi:RNA polymerase sigma factor (sigma-70 family)